MSTTTTTKVRGVERPNEVINPLLHQQQQSNGDGNNQLMNYALVTNQDEEHFVEKQLEDNYNLNKDGSGSGGGWRGQLLQWVHWKPIQLALLMLLLLDVLILFVEVFLMSLFPACSIIERDAIPCCPTEGYYGNDYDSTGYHDKGVDDYDHHRFLGGGGGANAYCDAQPELHLEPAYDYKATCDDHKWHTVHAVEEVFFAMTIFILSMFMLELNIEMICLSPCVFFRQFFYLFDYIIISTSLSLELSFFFLHYDTKTSVVGLLVIARVWRFVRIGHGIVGITTEVNHERFRKLLAYTEQLEEILQKERLDFPDRPSNINDATTSSSGEGKDQPFQTTTTRQQQSISTRSHSTRFSSIVSSGTTKQPPLDQTETCTSSSRLSDTQSSNHDPVIPIIDRGGDGDGRRANYNDYSQEDTQLDEYEC